MAYTPKSKMFEEDDARTRNVSSAGATTPMTSAAPMGTASGGTPPTPQGPQAPAAPAQQKLGAGPGTGFVNMDQYLAANKGIGSKVTSLGNSLLKKESGAYDKANDAATTAANAGVTQPGANVDNAIGMIGAGRKISDEDMKAIQDALKTTYSGPTSIGYNSGANGGAEAKALTNSKIAGQIIAQNAGNKIQGGMAGYSPQLSAMDAALYGGEKSAQAATKNLGTSVKAEQDRQKAGNSAFNTLVQGQQQKAGDISKGVGDRLGGIAAGVLGNAQGALQNAQAFNTAYGGTTNPELGNFISNNGIMPQIAQALGNQDLNIQGTGNWQYTNPNAGQMGPQIDLMSQYGDVPNNVSADEVKQAAELMYKFPGLGLDKVLAQKQNDYNTYQKWLEDHPNYQTDQQNTKRNYELQQAILAAQFANQAGGK